MHLAKSSIWEWDSAAVHRFDTTNNSPRLLAPCHDQPLTREAAAYLTPPPTTTFLPAPTNRTRLFPYRTKSSTRHCSETRIVWLLITQPRRLWQLRPLRLRVAAAKTFCHRLPTFTCPTGDQSSKEVPLCRCLSVFTAPEAEAKVTLKNMHRWEIISMFERELSFILKLHLSSMC